MKERNEVMWPSVLMQRIEAMAEIYQKRENMRKHRLKENM